MKALIAFFLLLSIGFSTFLQSRETVIEISEDLQLVEILDSVYIHVHWMETEKWGRFSSNGLVIVSDGEALLIDTPGNDEMSKILLDYLSGEMDLNIVGVVPTHWHFDCAGGLNEFHKRDIRSYAYELTCEILDEKDNIKPKTCFNDSLTIDFNGNEIELRFLGEGHSLDNIIVWYPEESLLFAGCMVKAMLSNSLGYTADGDIKAWPATLKILFDNYSEARIVVPGHGEIGGSELILHTIDLLEK